MYNFKDTIDRILTPDRSSFALIVDGVNFEERWPEFRTLRVDGRDLAEYDITSTAAPSFDGEIYEDSLLTSRELKVTYQIRAASSDRLRRIYEEMNAFFFTRRIAKFSFADDPNFYFVGGFAVNNPPPEDKNVVVGDMTVRCPQPYKYSNPTTKSGTSVDLALSSAVKVIGSVKLTAAASNALVKLQGPNMSYVEFGPVVAGRVYELRFDENKTEIYEGIVRKMPLFSIDSNLDQFDLPISGPLKMSSGESITVTYQELRL